MIVDFYNPVLALTLNKPYNHINGYMLKQNIKFRLSMEGIDIQYLNNEELDYNAYISDEDLLFLKLKYDIDI